MKYSLFTAMFLLFAIPIFGSSDSLAVSIFNKCQKAHVNLKNKKIDIHASFFLKNGESFSTSGEAIISKSVNYVNMLGIENITFPEKQLMIQVQEPEKLITLYSLPKNSEPKSFEIINNPDIFNSLKGLSSDVKMQFKLVSENSSYYLMHIYTLQQWTYDLVAIKILKLSFLISEVIFITSSQNNSDANRAVFTYKYSDIGTLPPKLNLDYYVSRKNSIWQKTKRFNQFDLNDFTS